MLKNNDCTRLNKVNLLFSIMLFFFGFSLSRASIDNHNLWENNKKPAPGFLHANEDLIMDKNGEPILLRGIGLGGWMLQEPYMLKAYSMTNETDIRKHIKELIGKEKTEEFYEAYLENGIQKEDVKQLKEWGFNSIRVPMHYNLFTLSVEDEPKRGENTWLEKGFTLLDRLIDWSAEYHIYVILDLHAAPGGQGHDLPIADRDSTTSLLWQSEAKKQKTIALWKKLAKRYKDNEWVGGYDLLNETNVDFDNLQNTKAHDGGDNKPLWDLLKDITKAIRSVDKNHLIFIEGNGWANDYSDFPGPWDDNMTISFHKYEAGDKNSTKKSSIQKFLDLREKYNIPLWLGESGENDDEWYAKVVDLMEENQIGWAWWPLKKLGDNNPLKVKTPSKFQKILDYWNGKGSKPPKKEAYEGLMKLTENFRFENCVKQNHIIKALFK